MNTIKKLREKAGFTQAHLAEKTGLSLRTIQRLESSDKPPKGHSLLALSKAFNVEPVIFREDIAIPQSNETNDKISIQLINLSTLAFFLFPFGNIILSYIIWTKKRQSKTVDEAGKRIINFQILWSIILCFSLSISPFIEFLFLSSYPLIFVVLIFMIAVNLFVLLFTANSIHQNKFDFLDLPIRLL